MANRQREDNHIAERVYGYLAEDEDARVCKDIPDEACSEQPTAFILHLWSLTLTKLGDSLVSARLVLPWMLSVAGAPRLFHQYARTIARIAIPITTIVCCAAHARKASTEVVLGGW